MNICLFVMGTSILAGARLAPDERRTSHRMADVLLSQIDAITAKLRDGIILSLVPGTLIVAFIAVHVERIQ